MVNERSVDYYLSPSRLISEIDPVYIYSPLRALSPELLSNFCQTCISHHGLGKFLN